MFIFRKLKSAKNEKTAKKTRQINGIILKDAWFFSKRVYLKRLNAYVILQVGKNEMSIHVIR